MFGHGIFQRYVFMLSTRLLDLFELEEMVYLTKHGATSLRSTSRGVPNARVMMNMIADTIIFSLCRKLKNQSLKLIVITFCKKLPTCDRVIKRGLSNLSSLARW